MYLYYKYLLRFSLGLLIIQAVLGFRALSHFSLDTQSYWWQPLFWVGLTPDFMGSWLYKGLFVLWIFYLGLIYSIILLHHRDPSVFWRLFLHGNNLSLAVFCGIYGWIWVVIYWIGSRIGKHLCLIHENT